MRFNLHKSLIKSWLLSGRHNVKLLEMLKKVHEAPADIQARHFIDSIKSTPSYRLVYFKKNKNPVYIPRSISYQDLLDVIYEIMVPNNWHYYEKRGTEIHGDDIIIDCGASEGLFSFSAYKRCKKIYAIEPLPRFVKTLRKTFRNIKNVTVVPIALSNKEGIGYIDGKSIGSHLCNDASKTKVRLSTLDNLFCKKNVKISYIKVDVEGHEFSLLEGATKTIARYQPRLAIAVYHKKGNAKLATNYIKSIDHRYNVHTSGVHPHTGEPIMLHARVH